MRNIPSSAPFADRMDHEPRRSDLEAASSYEPPSPAQLFTRLGALVAVALGFALAAQILIGATH